MTKSKIYLVVQGNCPSCLHVKTQLRKIENWDKVITVINMFNSKGEVNTICKEYEINEAPTLFAIEDDKLKASVRGSNVITRSFLRATVEKYMVCLLYTSPSPRDKRQSRMPSSA